MRPKAILSVVVGIALLLSFGVGIKDAKADVLMFPWIVKSTAVSTIVSVVNTAGIAGTYEFQSVPFRLHYQYWYKNSTENLQTETCTNHSFKQFTSKDDIITFDAAGNLGNGRALFNDASPYDATQPMNLIADAPRRAFLLVDNNTPAFVNFGDTNVDGTLYGEALVLELSGGAAWGYIAYNASGGDESSQTSPVSFTDGLDPLGEVIGGAVLTGAPNEMELGEVTQTTLYPVEMGTTRFFMTPVDSDIGDLDPNNTVLCGTDGIVNQRSGNINTRVMMVIDENFIGGGAGLAGGIYDNDEEVLDFNNPKNIVCTSADDMDQLVSGGALSYLQTTGQQAWSFIATMNGTWDGPDFDICPDNPSTDMIIGKLEFTTTGITIAGTPINGTFNNFVWLRDSNSAISGTVGHGEGTGTNALHNEEYQPTVP
jgi:hypothetical protein